MYNRSKSMNGTIKNEINCAYDMQNRAVYYSKFTRLVERRISTLF